MRKLLILGGFVAFAAVTPALAQQTSAPSEAPATSSSTSAPNSAIADKVKADWSKYDAGSKGHLTQAELGKWLGDLRSAAGQPAPDAEWTATAFAQTDTNGDKKVSEAELSAFLASGN